MRYALVRDDRGQRVRRRWERHVDIAPFRSMRLRDAPRWFALSSALAAALIVLWALYIGIVHASLGDALGVAGVLALAEFLLLAYLLPIVNTPVVARHRRACPACLYDLTGLHPEADGCTLCPECSAAWSLPFREEPSD
jgi:hypothetical protein